MNIIGLVCHNGSNQYALCALASCRIPGFLLVLLALVGDFMQTLHLIEKVCIKSAMTLHASFLQTCRLFKSLHSLRDADFFFEKCASSLHKVCRVCTRSVPSLHQKGSFVWDNPPFLKKADLMQTQCRQVQT